MSIKTVVIDGSMGEGGGQIVRSSLALSMVTGQPLRIENIRAGRKKPGLKRQHLTGLNAAAMVSNASVTGGSIGASQIEFEPSGIFPGEYHFQIGTAGSATLVLQTILPALMISDAPSTVTVEGGTHNQWAPPFDFLKFAYLPVLKKLGPVVDLDLHQHGFYPRGGGKFTAYITPANQLNSLKLMERGVRKNITVESLISNLPRSIASREVKRATRKLRLPEHAGRITEVRSVGPGNVLLIHLEHENICEVISSCGRLGTSAETVADEAIREAKDYLDSQAVVGQHLADQIILLSGIGAQQGMCSRFRTLPLTQHSLTHIEVVKRFLDVKIDVMEVEESRDVIVAFEPL